MAVSVVEGLEIVEVQQEQGQWLLIAVRPVQFDLELKVKMAGILKLGEAIYDTQFTLSIFAFLERLLHPLALGDVEQDPLGADHLPFRVEDGNF
jgi:hypothetical protein